MSKTLFGIPVPEGATKASIKPSLGARGNAKALWQGSLERDGCCVEETDIITEVADNTSFWQYIDLQVQAKRLTQKDPNAWLFKLLISFEDQAGIKSESVLTSEEHEFFRRTVTANSSPQEQCLLRMISLMEKFAVEMPKSAMAAIAETGKQSAAVVAATVEPLKATIEQNNKAYEAERLRYDSSVKLAMRMLESKNETNVFDDVAKLAPFAPFVKPLVDKLLN